MASFLRLAHAPTCAHPLRAAERFGSNSARESGYSTQDSMSPLWDRRGGEGRREWRQDSGAEKKSFISSEAYDAAISTRADPRARSPIFPRRVLERDSTIAARLRAAGAQLVAHFPSRSPRRFSQTPAQTVHERSRASQGQDRRGTNLGSDRLAPSFEPNGTEATRVLVGFSPFPWAPSEDLENSNRPPGGCRLQEAGSSQPVDDLHDAKFPLCWFKPSAGTLSRHGVFPSHVSLFPPGESRSCVSSCRSDKAIPSEAAAATDGAEATPTSAFQDVNDAANALMEGDTFRPDTFWIAASSVAGIYDVFKVISGSDDADLVTKWRDVSSQRQGAEDGGASPQGDRDAAVGEADARPPETAAGRLRRKFFRVPAAGLRALFATRSLEAGGRRLSHRVLLLSSAAQMAAEAGAHGGTAPCEPCPGMHTEPNETAPNETSGPATSAQPSDDAAETPRVSARFVPPGRYMRRGYETLIDRAGEAYEVPAVTAEASERSWLGFAQLQAAVQVIAACESVTDLARFDGMRDMEENDLDDGALRSRVYWDSVLRRRTRGFSDDAKDCMLAGAYALSQFAPPKLLDRALAVRTRAAEALSGIFGASEILLWIPPTQAAVPRTQLLRGSPGPTAPAATQASETVHAFPADKWMRTVAELLGLPLLQFRCGITLLGSAGADHRLLEVGQLLVQHDGDGRGSSAALDASVVSRR
ncbi:hypothetical protein BESB_037920 [Besnoitia besnoiti]|uniref:Uncharacterized protein n=1 Tax=Besnoitia besnoiti TaxID=94643 RepID=A0A2A9MJH7_BESBE|nr:hypothetical protein BESB_037920 [Besnoitia besnoiti]PFH37334.1 hypothetical protein BESB_037920 [Besnoitia besnoiti]